LRRAVNVEYRLAAPGSDDNYRALLNPGVTFPMDRVRRHKDEVARLCLNYIASFWSGLHPQDSRDHIDVTFEVTVVVPPGHHSVLTAISRRIPGVTCPSCRSVGLTTFT
jgi:hypothetical protein